MDIPTYWSPGGSLELTQMHTVATTPNHRKDLENGKCGMPSSAFQEGTPTIVYGTCPRPQWWPTEHHQKVKLEQTCLAKADQHFTQAQSTPCLMPPLLGVFGEKGMSKEFSKVMSGNYTPLPTCNLYAAKFLTAVYRLEGLKDITPCTAQNYCQSWRRAWESTSSSASGIHFGITWWELINSEILVVNATMANIPLGTGFSFSCWKKGINVMIKKTCGNFNVK